jgi:hypothetical protein
VNLENLRSPHIFEKNGYPSHWWAALCAVPATKDSTPYRRLKRAWFDHTRFHGPSAENPAKRDFPVRTSASTRYHEFVKSSGETHLTLTLWENFVIFDLNKWLPAVFEAAGLRPITARIEQCKWCYEWVSHANGKKRMCDIVLAFESGGARNVVVIEAKRLDASMTQKDLDLAYYLESIPEIADFGDRRHFIYLLDETRRNELDKAIRPREPRVGILTWQRLAGVQIELAKGLDASVDLQNFIAGAIQYQFAQHDIRPTALSADYLESEPSVSAIDDASRTPRQAMSIHLEPFWQLH